MSSDWIERQVASFLDRREIEPGLEPEVFASAVGGDPELLDALRAALGVEERLCEGGAALRRSIGPYHTVRVLGQGGMGTVFEVEREGRRFALKRLHPSLSGSRARQRFEREAALLKRLDHPGIVAVRDIGREADDPYLVMDLVEGEPLLDAAASWSLELKLRAVIALCDAVEAVHREGLVHRDLKPHNVIVRRDGTPVLVDFGLGVAEDDVTLTSSGDLLGTPRYMAPEQARGEATDARTDVWGLGQILFELATGRPAIDATSRARLLRDVARARIPRPRSLRPDVPAQLERIVLQALAEEPGRRYPRARDLADDLTRFLAGEPVRARPPGPASRAWSRVRRRPALALAVSVVAAALATSLLVVRSRAIDARRAAAGAHVDLALLAWTSGDADGARREAEAALEFAAHEPRARALLATATKRVPSADADPWTRTLAALDQGRPRDAALAIAALADRDPLAGALEAHAWRLEGDAERATSLLEPLAAAHPRSALVAAEAARAWRDQGQPERAARELERALELRPDDHRLRLELAQDLLAAGAIERAVDVALEASSRDASESVVTPPELARVLGRASDPIALRAALERCLASEPDRDDARFALAVSLDSAHDVRGAASAYRAVLDSRPEHGWALAYLGHLRAGADMRRCERCRAVFDADPSLVDRVESGRLLAAAVRADRGRDRDLVRAVVFLAREHDLAEPVLAALDDALLSEATATQRSRLLDARQGLRR